MFISMKVPFFKVVNVKAFLITFLGMLLCSTLLSYGQSRLSTNSKKAESLYYEADNHWVRGQFTTAFEILKEAVKKDKDFYEAYFRLGVIDKSRGNTTSAETYLLKTLELKNDHAGANFELGELYIQMGEYEKSIGYSEKYLGLNPRNAKRKTQAEKFVESAKYAIENIKTAAEFNPRALPEHINQYAMQYFPVITADEEYLIYTRRLGTTMNHDEDLVVTKKDSLGNWGDPESISENINSSFNEGTCTISADGRILIFTSCYGRNGYGSCDLYISKKTGNDWSAPKNLGGVVNSQAWDSQPSLSADGRALYFISNRPNGIGQRDIWMTQLDDGDKWTKPKNLGPLINTVDDEVSPFIHPNNRTLYFGSNGRKGFGGFDIYFSEFDGHWTEPKNLGYPINTGEDQVSLFITAGGTHGYYSHENLSSPDVKGEIYEFDMPEALKVKYRAFYVKGKVIDEKTKEPLGAEVELYDLKKDERILKVESDSITGDYLMVLPEGSSYAFYVNKEGYLFKSLSFDYDSGQMETLKIDIPLKRVEVGGKTVLKNIFFDFDKYELKPASKTELQKVLKFLRVNPDIKIQIAGHTDNRGAESYNQELSRKRAKSVYEFLVSNGIENSRLTFRGYGHSQPVASNQTEKGRQQNRRIEFEIIK